MRVARSVSVQTREVRVTLRSVQRDVRLVKEEAYDTRYHLRAVKGQLEEVTAHLQTVTVKLDNQTRLLRMSFAFVICILVPMLFFTESTWFMMWMRRYM